MYQDLYIGLNVEAIQVPFFLNDFAPLAALKDKYIDWENLKYGYDYESGLTATPEDVKNRIDSRSLINKINYLSTTNVLVSNKINFSNSLDDISIEIVEHNGIISFQIRWIYEKWLIDKVLFNDVDEFVSFDLELKKNFIPSIGYRGSWTLSNPSLNWDTSTKFKSLSRLNLIDPIVPRTNWEAPVMATRITLVTLLIVGSIGFIIIKKHKQKKYLTEEIRPKQNKKEGS